MPLHNWNELGGWEGVHIFWMTEIARSLKIHLPAGYRAFIGASPYIAVDMSHKPDEAFQSLPQQHDEKPEGTADAADAFEPDLEFAAATLEEDNSVLVECAGRLVAAVELISPRNKDRPASRAHCGARYLSYLKNGIHLMLVDVHPRPLEFSFAKLNAESLSIEAPKFHAPLAISYRVGEPAANGGRLLAIKQKALAPAEELPAMPLALDTHQLVNIDLEATYRRAAEDAYLD